MKLYHITHAVCLPLIKAKGILPDLRAKGVRPATPGIISVLLKPDRDRAEFECSNNLFFDEYVVVEFQKGNHSLLKDRYDNNVRRELRLKKGCASIKDFQVCFSGTISLHTQRTYIHSFAASLSL